MKSIILYGAKTKLTNAHRAVQSSPKQPAYFVRMELRPGSVLEALDKANPMFGETVLNTIEVQP